jgi:hypothetical protein
MSKRNRIISAKMLFLIIIFSLSGSILMGFCGLYLPLKEKNDLKKRIGQKQEELSSYGSVEDRYIALSAQFSKITAINSAFKALKSNNLKMTQIFQDLQENIPGDIIIQNISYSNMKGELTIDGLSRNYKNIAQYIVKLRQLDYILDVGFTSVVLESPEAETNTVTDAGTDIVTESGNGNKDMPMQKFSIKISLKNKNSSITVTNLQEDTISDEKGGE